MKTLQVILGLLATLPAIAAPPRDTPAGEQRFRELYKELVETNTSPVVGQLHAGRGAHGGTIEGGGFSGKRPAPVRRRPATKRKAGWSLSIRAGIRS